MLAAVHQRAAMEVSVCRAGRRLPGCECQHGLEVETHLGGAYRRSTTDLEFPCRESWSSLILWP